MAPQDEPAAADVAVENARGAVDAKRSKTHAKKHSNARGKHKGEHKVKSKGKSKGKNSKRPREQEEAHPPEGNVEAELSDDERETVRQVVSPVLRRFVRMNKSFPAASAALVEARHPAILSCLAFLKRSGKAAEAVEHKPRALLQFLREELWLVAKQWYELSEECRGTLLAASVVEEAVALVSDTFVLPVLYLEPSLIASRAELRTPALRAWLRHTAASHRQAAEKLAFQLNDAFTMKRKQIHAELRPLQESIEAADWLLSHWSDADAVAPEDLRPIRTAPMRVPREALEEHEEYLREVYAPSRGELVQALHQYLALREWRGKELLGLALGSTELPTCDLDYLKDRSEYLQEKADNIAAYLESPDQDEPAIVPDNVTAAVRYASKEEINALITTNKALIPEMQRTLVAPPGESEEDAAARKRRQKTVDTMKDDNKFLAAVLHNWDTRKKTFLKFDKWTVKIASRELAPAKMDLDEAAVLRGRQIEYTLQRWGREQEFQQHLEKELQCLGQSLATGLLLGLLTEQSYDEHVAAVRLAIGDEGRLGAVDIDALPGLSRKERKILRSAAATIEAGGQEGATAKKSKKKKAKKKAKDAKAERKLSKARETAASLLPIALSALERQAEVLGELRQELGAESKDVLEVVAGRFEELFAPVCAFISPETLAASVAVEEANSHAVAELWKSLFDSLLATGPLPAQPPAPSLPKKAGKNAPAGPTPEEAEQMKRGDCLARALVAAEHSVVPHLLESDAKGLKRTIRQVRKELPEDLLPAPLAVHLPVPCEPTAQEVNQGMLVLSWALQERAGAAEEEGKRQRRTCLSLGEKRGLLTLLANAKQFRMRFNADMTKLKENMDKLPHGISEEAAKFMSTFSFKSRHLDALAPLSDKLYAAWAKAYAGEAVAKAERMTLKELGILRTTDKWGGDLECLVSILGFELPRKGDFDDGHSDSAAEREAAQLEELEAHSIAAELVRAVRAHRQLRGVYKELRAATYKDDTFQSGDLLLAIWKKKQMTMQGNRPPPQFNLLMSFTKYEHTAKVYRNFDPAAGPVGEPRLSHMYREFHDSELALEEMAYSDVFRILVAPLVTDSVAVQALEEKFGKELWKNELQTRYHQREATFHREQSVLRSLTNPISRVLRIGTAAVLPWTKRQRKHQDFQLVRRSLSSPDEVAREPDMEMTCSEFAINATISCLLDLNDELSKELESTSVADNLPATIIRIPFPAKEKFSTMQPARLKEILEHRKALVYVPPPAFISALLK